MHVDEFIDMIDLKGTEDHYARFFFLLKRLPAFQQLRFDEWISRFKLFCTYESERYRVTGASRLGNVWLTKDFEQETGYERRVDLDDCSEWSEIPENVKEPS